MMSKRLTWSKGFGFCMVETIEVTTCAFCDTTAARELGFCAVCTSRYKMMSKKVDRVRATLAHLLVLSLIETLGERCKRGGI